MNYKNNVIVKLLPYVFPVGKNQHVSIWNVAKSNIENSKFAENFVIISSTPQNEKENCLPNICYIPNPKNDHVLKKEFIENWNRYINISFNDYLQGVKKQIKRLNPTLIEVENDVKLAGKIAKAFPSIPVVFIPHVVIGKRNFFARVSQYWRYIRPIKEIIFVSNAHKKSFFKNFPYSKKPNNVIHNSYAHLPVSHIDLNDKNNNIIYVGRATKDKGYEEFITGVIPVINKYQNWNATAVMCVETKQIKNEFYLFLNQPHIQLAIEQGKLKILQNVPNKELFKLFEKAKIAVFPTHPSWIEGLPLVGIEAHYAKCAVITSQNPGFKELSGANILYLDSVTSKEVSNKVEYLINNPNTLKEYALSGYNNLIKNYNIKDLVKTYDSIREKYL